MDIVQAIRETKTSFDLPMGIEMMDAHLSHVEVLEIQMLDYEYIGWEPFGLKDLTFKNGTILSHGMCKKTSPRD